MSGLEWISYATTGSLDAGYNNSNQLYQNAITFFNSAPTAIATGVTTILELNMGVDTPPLSTFSLGPTENIGIQFSGYFCPNQTGNWTIHLGAGPTNPCDDFGVLFLGEPNAPIVPNATFSVESSVPSSTDPFIFNKFNTGNNSKTVSLQAGNSYPILIYYNQGRYGYTLGLSYSYDGGSRTTDFTDIIFTTPQSNNNNNTNNNIACFKEGTKILTDIGYKPIEEMLKGDRIKTVNHDYQPIVMIGKRNMEHFADKKRVKDQLYRCSSSEYPELIEDLVITGCHAILVDSFKEDEREETKELLGNNYVTDGKYRLPACIDKRTSVYETPGTYTIYHVALENDDYYMNYGIYANGLLVESCSKRYLKEISKMTLIE